MSELIDTILSRQNGSFNNLATKRLFWDQAEKLIHNQLQDGQSNQAKSQVFDPKLSTLILERSYRVMAQLQTGKVRGISKNDIGDAMLKNLVLEKYILPNANAQFDFLTKLRMVDMYSNIYGAFFTLIDWDVRKNGYIGPDMWLLNIRDVFPQVGAVSLDDSEYVIVRTWKPLSYFENLKKADGYKNIDEIVTKLKDLKSTRDKRTTNEISKREENQYPQRETTGQKGYFEVLTQFERDRWVDVAVDAQLEFRDQKNPHDDEDLPVKCKYSIPLLDDFMGMGDVERGRSMQMVVNSNWNLYLDGVKTSLNPPILINKDNVASMSSLQYIPGAKWMMRNSLQNGAMPIQLNPQGIATFNNVHQVATASLMNVFGTTDTTSTQQTDPGFGKTPQALQMQQSRENTRDNADRFYMEQFVTSVMKKFVNLTCKKQTSAITVRLFEDEIKQLERSYPDITDHYDNTTGKLTVKKGENSTLYDYEIVSGSTFAADQKQQQANMAMLLQLYQSAQTPQGNMLVQQLAQEGYNFKFGELFKRIVSSSGIQDWDKILEEMTAQEQADHTLNSDAQQFQQALQQMMTQGQTPVDPMQQQQQEQQMNQQVDGGLPIDQGAQPMQ
jgi:hypothetical protein